MEGCGVGMVKSVYRDIPEGKEFSFVWDKWKVVVRYSKDCQIPAWDLKEIVKADIEAGQKSYNPPRAGSMYSPSRHFEYEFEPNEPHS